MRQQIDDVVPQGSVLGAAVWPSIAGFTLCVAVILGGPFLWNVPCIGSYVQAGDWLMLVVVFIIWLLTRCRHRRLGNGRCFLSFLVFFWPSAVLIEGAYLYSEFHTVTSMWSVVNLVAIYPLVLALCGSGVGVIVYLIMNYFISLYGRRS